MEDRLTRPGADQQLLLGAVEGVEELQAWNALPKSYLE